MRAALSAALLLVMAPGLEARDGQPQAGAGEVDSALARYDQAESLRGLGRWGEALEEYRASLALDESRENAWIGEADVLVALGRFEAALERLETALERFPASRGIQFGLAWLLSSAPEASLRDGDRAVELAEVLFEARRSLGAAELGAAALAQAGRCDEALNMQRFVLQHAPHFDRTAVEIARFEKAEAWFSASPCRVPEGQDPSARGEWPRASAEEGQ